LKRPEADALHKKLEQTKEILTADNSNAITLKDSTTIEDIIRTTDKEMSNLYLQCKTLQNLSQS